MSTALDEAGVRHVARLARLAIPEAQVSVIAAELGRVIDYMRVLESAPVGRDAVSDAAPLWRADHVAPSLPRTTALAAAKEATEAAFVVPKVVG